MRLERTRQPDLTNTACLGCSVLVRAYRTQALQYVWVPAALVIGYASLVMWVLSVVYNYHLTKKLKKDCKRDMNDVATNNAIYAVVDFLMLGSLDMMVVYPWILDEEKRTLNQNYPSKNAVDDSIKSQAAEVSRDGE